MRRNAVWLIAWLAVSGVGGIWIARSELARLQDLFETESRIAHRLLSQRVSQHDAVLAMLALFQPSDDASPSLRRLPAVYPQIIDVQRRARNDRWPDQTLQWAETVSRERRHAVIARFDAESARYTLLRAADPESYAIQIDMQAMVPWNEWPMARDASGVNVTLELEGRHLVLQAGRLGDGGWRYVFRKRLAAESQPFDMVAMRHVTWGELPWMAISLWLAVAALVLLAVRALRRQRVARQRAEELLRLGQVGRLNALGEMAAGMAHELNQPLTAVLASTQAARRLLVEEPPDIATAREAIEQAAEQARRASDVVGSLRRAAERPDLAARAQAVTLQQAVQNALYLLEPECRRVNVSPSVDSPNRPVKVLAEPVALEQIIHNLINNALQALEQVPEKERSLTLSMTEAADAVMLTVRDSGPGIPPDALPRVFEPFFSLRRGGLGLGLSLCESLATAMGGTLSAANQPARGAMFTLKLPRAAPA